MIKTRPVFRLICTFYAIVFSLLFVDPAISAADLPIYAAAGSDPSPDAPTGKSAEAQAPHIPAYYLDETSSSELPSDPLPLYDRLTVQERRDRQLPTQLPAVSPHYGNKIVYLTFDDGPDPQNTPQVIEILKNNGIKATFFMVGTEIEKYPALVKQVYEAGHAVGNHSYDHIYRNLYQSPAAYTAELRHTDDLLKAVIGVRPRISRAPGGTVGSFTKQYWSVLKEQGYIEMGWNISSGDASAAKAPDLIGNIAYQLDNKYLWSHAVVLMHDGRGHAETVKALPQIIQLFKDRGFEFRVVNAQTPPPW